MQLLDYNELRYQIGRRSQTYLLLTSPSAFAFFFQPGAANVYFPEIKMAGYFKKRLSPVIVPTFPTSPL